MPALTITNIPDSLYEQLKTAAELRRRSSNSQVLVCGHDFYKKALLSV